MFCYLVKKKACAAKVKLSQAQQTKKSPQVGFHLRSIQCPQGLETSRGDVDEATEHEGVVEDGQLGTALGAPRTGNGLVCAVGAGWRVGGLELDGKRIFCLFG